MTEAQVLASCIQLLSKHPKVALFWRQGVSKAKFGGRTVSFGKRGQSDLMAVLRPSGKFLACEVKAPGKSETDEQYAFLQSVVRSGGLACCVDDVSKLAKFLEVA